TAQKLLDPKSKLSEAESAALVGQIGDSARSIQSGLHDSKGRAGKDQNDAVEESKVIGANVDALQHAKLSPAERRLLIQDISSKSGLIDNELADVPNEVKEAQNDTKAVKLGEHLEAQTRYALDHPGHASKTIEQLRSGLSQLHNDRGDGALDQVVADRK